MSNETKIRWTLLFVILMWGSNFVVIKVLLDHFPFWTLLFFRNSFAALCLVLIVRQFLHIIPATKKIWGYVIGASVIGVVINNVLFQYGLNYSLATNASLIMGLTPLATAFISFLVFQSRLHWLQMIGIMMGLFGVAIVVLDGSINNLLSLSFNIGDLYVIGSLLTFTISFVFIKKAADLKFPPALISLYAYCLSSICYLPFAVWEQLPAGLSGLPSNVFLWLMLLYVGIFPTGLGNMWWNRGISILGPSQCAIFMNGVPVVAAIIAAFVLSEPILSLQIVGFIFIAIGVLLGSKNWAREKTAGATLRVREKTLD